ncbi:MAG: C-20 methyltransferase BchU [Chloroflexota bacterium]|nr:C-20 methyltransferase BchU [Chloroflexota bacterium]
MSDTELLRTTDTAYDMVFKSAVDFSCIKAAFDLGLFQALAAGPRDLAGLAQKTESVPVRLERFLLTLWQIGLVEKRDQQWALTSLSNQFFTASLEHRNLTMVPFVDYLSTMFEGYYLHLADVVRGNRNFTSFVPHPPRTREDSLYYETLHRSNLYFPIKLLVERAKLEENEHLIDVGGGIGDIASAVCKQFPNINITLINLPNALGLVSENVAANGLEGRITPTAVDMYREPYPTGDALLFSRILYPLGAQFCTMLCQKAFAALEPGGRILILDMIISNPERPNYDYLTHYLGGVGMDFSPFEFKNHNIYPDVLRSAGFVDVQFDEAYDHVLYQAIKPA